MIDLTERILQPAHTPRPAAPSAVRWHPVRRALQVLCGVLLVALPLTNGLRLDIRAGVFYFAWHRMAAHDLVLLFWVAMLGVWALVAVSFLYGRLWCGWVCPQTLASDFASSVKTRLDKMLRARPGRPPFYVSRALWTLIMGIVSVGTGMTVAAYWLAPHTVARATFHPAADMGAALVVYGIAAVLLADMLWVRRKFCAHACPYGALMGLLADKNTLAVRFLTEREDDCISCGKCVTDCPMDIDIKRGAGQIECIGCGECVDACNDVLGKRGIPGLIEFRYGLGPERVTQTLPLPKRWGLWDATRLSIVATLALFAAIVAWQISGRVPLAGSVLAKGAITRDAHAVRNDYALTLSNGTPDPQTFALTVDGLPQGTLVPATVTLASRDTVTLPVAITAPPAVLETRRRYPLRLRVRGRGQGATIRTFFYAP